MGSLEKYILRIDLKFQRSLFMFEILVKDWD